MYFYHFAQSVYGEEEYGSSFYGADETTSQTQLGGNGLIDTGSPVLWGGVFGVSLILATIFTAIAAARNRKKDSNNK